MKKTINKTLAILLACVMILGGAPLEALSQLDIHLPSFDLSALTNLFEIKASAAETSGTCGDNLTWNYDESTATLTISGTGAMDDYASQDYNGTKVTTAPWQQYDQTMARVVIDSGVTSLGNYAFYACSALSDVVIPNSVTSVAVATFYNCVGLSSVYSTDLAQWCGIAFSRYYSNPLYYAHNLYINNQLVTNLVIPDSVTSVGNYAFIGCVCLTSVTIGNGVTTIGSQAFENCSNLTNVTLGDHVTTIEDRAFRFCSKLKDINLPNSVLTINEQAFTQCYALTNIIFPSGISCINESVLSFCNSLTSVTIPGSVTTIGQSAFTGCTKLVNVFFKGDESQWNSITIKAYNEPLLNATRTYIPTSGSCGDNLTWELDETTNALIISGTGTMDDYSSGTMPWSYYKNQIQSIVIEDGITSVGDFAFYNCSNLSSVSLSESIIRIGDRAFGKNDALESITIPDNVISIGDYAFTNCIGLKSVSIGRGTSNIGAFIVYGCTVLNSLTVSSENTNYHAQGNCLIETDSKTLIAGCNNSLIPNDNSIKIIADSAFKGCNRLINITIPDGVTKIDNYAFSNCSRLVRIRIPQSIAEIGDYAFYSCSILRDVYYEGAEDSWNNVEIGIQNTGLNRAAIHCCVVVPQQSASCTADGMSSYAYWSNTNPIEYIVEPSIIPKNGSHIPSLPVIEHETAATCGTEGRYDSVVYCSVCGEEISRQTITVPATEQHTPSAVVTENETDATCAAAGRYDSVVYCSACGLELSRETIAVPATGQHIADSPVNENEIGATCGTDGQYESVIYCSVCGVELSRQTVLVPAINQHTPSTAVTENEISATCTQAGYYDSVVYCSVCLAELNRETITVPATGHTANSAVRENEIAATCAAAGRYDSVVYCSACGAELSRDTITVPATDQHTPGTAVTENEIAATCTQTGHYDSVVYCAICNQELVRETIITPVTAHSFSSYTSNGDATCTQDGTKTAKCNNCEATNTVIDEGTALGHNFVNYVSNYNATLIQDGTKTAKCERCDAEDTVPDRGTAILTYVIRNDAVEITKCKQSFAGTMEIPEMINGYPVTTIGEEAFYNCTGMTGVTLPNSVRTIGVSAFSHCTALASIAIPNGVTSIEDYAFSDCNSVASITIADSVQSIGRNVFSNCTEWYAGLENGPVVVDGYLLDYKGSMPENTELSFNAVRMIATNALKNQSNLKRAVFGDTLERVSKGAFSGCFGLEEIELSDHVEYIHDDAFSGGDTLTVIGYYNEYVEAFANSNSFVYSPYTVTLTFNPTQGQMDSGTITVIAKKPLGDMSLPEPSCSELAFGGWYADEECIAMISGESVFEEDTTLYASWLSASSIAVKTMPERTQYAVGDYLDTIGLVLSASFSNGETKDISAGFTCTPNHLTRQGKYRIKVEFGGECAYFYVNVNESANVTVSVETLPNKTTYNTNEAFDPTGLVILLDYGNGITNRITKGLSFEYDFSTPGTKCVTINYSAGNSVLTTEIAVEVTEPVNEVYADNVSITNKIVSFPVRISQNSGLMGFSISLAYDEEVLEPISVVPNAALGGYMNDSIASSTSDSFSVVWFGTDVFAEDGVLFTTAFRLKTSDAVNTEIGLSYSERDTFDGDYNDVLLACRRILIPADATEAAIIFANDLNAGSGETVSIPVYVSNPSGLTQATVTFSYDHTAFSYVGVSSDCGTVAATNGNKLVIRWDGSIPEDGVIFTIQMQSAANMIGKYPFIVNCISSAFNDSGTVECSDFAVSVRNQTAARVYCETPTFVPGEDISVNICIEDNPGMMGCTLFVTFDSSVLTFKSVSRKSVIRSGSFDYSIDNGTLKLVWNSTDDVIDDGAMYELVFGMVDDDSYDSTDITLSFEENDTFNANWDPVMFSCESGTLRTHNDATVTAISVKSLPAKTTYRVGDSLETTGLSLTVTKNDGTTETVTSGFTCTPTVLTGVGSQVITVTYQDQATTFTVNVYDDVLPGDANADETVDLKDVVILQRYLAGGWNVSVSGSNADVNKDGEVNVKDVVLLSRYLAGGWNVTLI